MVRAELQEQPTNKIESAKTSPVQSEAIGLLNSNRPGNDANKMNPVTNGVLEFSNVFESKFNKLPEKTAGSCSITKPACESGARDFRPDPLLRSRQAREWHGKSQEQRQKPLDVDKDGNYQVKKGDSLWTIAERMGTGKDGRKPNARTILDTIKGLTEANPQLCNPDYLKEGRTLKIPRQDQQGNARQRDGQGSAGAQSGGDKPQDVQRRQGGVTDSNSRPQDAQRKPADGNARPQDVQRKPADSIGNLPPKPENSKKPDVCIEVKPAPMPQLKAPADLPVKPVPMPTLPEIRNEKWKPAPMPVLREEEALCFVPPAIKR